MHYHSHTSHIPTLTYQDIEVKVWIEEITPERAAEILAGNTGNRKLRGANLAKLTAAVENGEWQFNGQPIILSADGHLESGQHRLETCVRTGISIISLIVKGVRSEAQDTMDAGESWRSSDHLRKRGYTNVNNLASITTAVIRWEKYMPRAAVSSAGSVYPVTTGEVIKRVESDPLIADAVKAGESTRRIGIPNRIGGVLWYRLHQIDAVDADFFFDRLASGANLLDGDPILAARNAVMAVDTTRGTKNTVWLAAVVVKAWNKYRSGEQAKLIRFTPGGANPEKFPEPR